MYCLLRFCLFFSVSKAWVWNSEAIVLNLVLWFSLWRRVFPELVGSLRTEDEEILLDKERWLFLKGFLVCLCCCLHQWVLHVLGETSKWMVPLCVPPAPRGVVKEGEERSYEGVRPHPLARKALLWFPNFQSLKYYFRKEKEMHFACERAFTCAYGITSEVCAVSCKKWNGVIRLGNLHSCLQEFY